MSSTERVRSSSFQVVNTRCPAKCGSATGWGLYYCLAGNVVKCFPILMNQKAGRISRWLVGVVTVAVLAAIVIWKFGPRHSSSPVPKPSDNRTTASASRPATAISSSVTAPVVLAHPTSDFLDVVRDHYPDFPSTQPLPFPLDLPQAAHIVIGDPLYLGTGPRADLWITRSDGPPLAQVLKDAADPDKDVAVHIVNREVKYVHWQPNDSGPWPPYLICPTDGGGYEVVSATKTQTLPRRDYRWNTALSWNDKIVVSCDRGVAVITFDPKLRESYHALATDDGAKNQSIGEPRFLLDWQGLLAWIPWERGKSGSQGAARYLEGSWTDLTPQAGWPAKIIHLVPLIDGTVLVLSQGPRRGTILSMMVLDKLKVDEKQIEELVSHLGDPDAKKREEAFKQLTRYGSGIWPILQKLLPNQDPETSSRLRLLLKEKNSPTLAGMKLLGDRSLQVVDRLADGGVILFTEAGVSLPQDSPDKDAELISPAWISIRPGEPIELLPDPLIHDLNPRTARIYAIGHDWFVSGGPQGPRRFIGNGFENLVRHSEVKEGFVDFLGEDRRGRWVIGHANPASGATTQADESTVSTSAEQASGTLVIDPTLPDPTPRLPVWNYTNAQTVGWDKDGWPVAKDISAYALHEQGWELLSEKEKVFTELPAPTTSPTAPTSAPSTQSATLPTAPTTEPAAPILVDHDGNQYFGGLTDLSMVSKDGSRIDWPLPAAAVGEGPATLIRANDGKLFLFNQTGRVLRIAKTPQGSEPFKLEATFTHKIPTMNHPHRIWLDPAGRIIMAWDKQLAILFPTGYIPPAIAEKMLGTDEDQDQ